MKLYRLSKKSNVISTVEVESVLKKIGVKLGGVGEATARGLLQLGILLDDGEFFYCTNKSVIKYRKRA